MRFSVTVSAVLPPLCWVPVQSPLQKYLSLFRFRAQTTSNCFGWLIRGPCLPAAATLNPKPVLPCGGTIGMAWFSGAVCHYRFNSSLQACMLTRVRSPCGSRPFRAALVLLAGARMTHFASLYAVATDATLPKTWANCAATQTAHLLQLPAAETVCW